MTPEFQADFKAGRTQLLWQTIPGDLLTPVSAYLKLSAGEPYSFLLESVEGGKTLGRYSIIGLKPDLVLAGETPDTIRKHLNTCRIDSVPENLPPMAVSGLFGYMGYGMARHIENIPQTNPDDLGIPESILIRPTLLIIFDNVQSQIYLVSPVYETQGNAEEIYRKHQNTLQHARHILESPSKEPQSSSIIPPPSSVISNMTKNEYTAAVRKCIEYIRQGEIFQAVLGLRFSCDFPLPPFDLYRALRRLNPSPFMFHLNMDGFALTGSSPEILVRVRDNTVTIRPIAGTRPRGKTQEEDASLAEDLLNDEKERAEHLMLLDLGRNDVGKVCEFGSVKVTAQNTVEKYSHVMHIVSNVEGTLRKDLDVLDALFSGFPAGTVSGAPKIRAMQIIDELEASQRGYYAGSIGYISGNRTMDTCIALRTGLIKDGKLHVQAGAGIVADSDPQAEYQECVNKSRALFAAAHQALKDHSS